MSNPNPTLLKTCSICGQQKPLAAFLQMAGPEGTTYGNVCSTCRSAGLDKPQKKEAEEGTPRSTIGYKIDSKAKVQSEKDKRNLRQQKEERYKDEHEKEVEEEQAQSFKKENIRQEEKGRREEQKQPRTFLDEKKASRGTGTSPADIAQAEQKTNLAAPFIDTQFGDKSKYTRSPLFDSFKKGVLGGASPLGQGELKKTAAEKKEAKHQAEKNFIDENFSPSSGRRR